MIRTLRFSKGKQKDIAILIPNQDFNEDQIRKTYIQPLKAQGISEDDIIIITIELNAQDKAPVSLIKDCMEHVSKMLIAFQTTRVVVCQSQYFKYLTKKTKVEVNYGYPIASPIISDITVFASIASSVLFTKPNYIQYLNLSLQAVAYHATGKSNMFLGTILKNIEYPKTLSDITDALNSLYKYPALTCDIETFGLQVNLAGLGTIAFAWDEHSGIAFPIDLSDNDVGRIRMLLKFFLQHYQGKLIFHNATFDTKVLIWELFMKSSTDIKGMLFGLDVLYRDMDDTKILSYLATNTTTGNALGLKQQAFEYAGNYGIEFNDETTIVDYPPEEITEYNLWDAVCTWYVYNKHRNTVLQDQETVYQEVFKPALKVITQMELIGVPLNQKKVKVLEAALKQAVSKFTQRIRNSPIMAAFTEVLRENAATEHTARLKKKIITAADYADLEFNPGSPKQMRTLLFDHLELPVQGTTHTGLASVDDKTLKRLLVHPDVRGLTPIVTLLEDISELAKATTILGTFVPAFLNRTSLKNAWTYLMGCFNLGGTVSGRLSSNGPNLTNMPSTGTSWAKMVKECFEAPPGWLFCGADFNSLEDIISALQTKDPEKLKIYEEGYDGHCLRAFAYFGGQMSDIELALEQAAVAEHPAIINSIATKYPKLRQDSKSPTFALTYQGTWRTLIKNFGFSEEEAKSIEKNYHALYKVSDDWVWDRVVEASQKGYVELAFGLRLRTPILPKTVLNHRRTLPYQAQKEIKTAGNALGQSYGLLNTRAGNEFMERVWASKWRYSVLPIMQIHDSLYFIIKDNIQCLHWVNNNLIECMEWNKLNEIQHPVVGLNANLEVFHPSWAESAKIPNKANQRTIKKSVAQLQ
jgi:DNA polymerase-1